ncbi:Orotidine-5'-phosphate decarboxylase [Thermogladius calderae 1633]|uniref:Orotidine 5'-phosphate decarboxylase n=1 Tax=Thermogladius calderae (strain DSM 22663 / VKM B-2946 / 1633) TaxID=1184251 RepID=I3TFF4_THEC1|nr:orotidine-5'-phosphate decarboxylase [Thermogladius calderae]AFK51492.1 Orotidine-5'-phosphate decarboxylase [Thermogladius calderae 1633]
MLVVALDPPFSPVLGEDYLRIVREVDPYAQGFKVGLPLILRRGVDVLGEIREATRKPVIADLKLADIGDVMASALCVLAEQGVDAVIAHGFVGVEGSLDKLVEEAEKLGVEVIVVASMSHRGSEKYIDKHVTEIVEDSLRLGVHGLVLPATRPSLIRLARGLVGGSLRIYSPGVGHQGAQPGDALCAGADYEIVGRAITRSESPGQAARAVLERQLERVRACRG